jgi:hypothetical protein
VDGIRETGCGKGFKTAEVPGAKCCGILVLREKTAIIWSIEGLLMVVNLQKEILGTDQWLGRKRSFCSTIARGLRCVIANGRQTTVIQFSIMVDRGGFCVCEKAILIFRIYSHMGSFAS